MSNDYFMQKCFKLALKALGNTSPNPLVGCVIVKNNKIVATGYHQKSGTAHAELDAINNTTESLQGATLYCNLEPCCHLNKKTPPCAQRIIKEGITKVVISNLDPNPEVAGKGVNLLRENGIEVITGVLEHEGAILNEVFFTHITKERPFIHLKWAQTIDGKIATKSHDSKWITSVESRQRVHFERSCYDAVAVGAKTAIKDNPELTIRIKDQQTYSKKRIVFTKGLQELPSDLKLFTDQYSKNTIVKDLSNLSQALKELYLDGIKSIYIEGGAQTLNLFLEKQLFDRISVYIAPKILGDGVHLNFGPTATMQDALKLDKAIINKINQDIYIQSQENLCLPDL